MDNTNKGINPTRKNMDLWSSLTDLATFKPVFQKVHIELCNFYMLYELLELVWFKNTGSR